MYVCNPTYFEYILKLMIFFASAMNKLEVLCYFVKLRLLCTGYIINNITMVLEGKKAPTKIITPIRLTIDVRGKYPYPSNVLECVSVYILYVRMGVCIRK